MSLEELVLTGPEIDEEGEHTHQVSIEYPPPAGAPPIASSASESV